MNKAQVIKILKVTGKVLLIVVGIALVVGYFIVRALAKANSDVRSISPVQTQPQATVVVQQVPVLVNPYGIKYATQAPQAARAGAFGYRGPIL